MVCVAEDLAGRPRFASALLNMFNQRDARITGIK